MAHDCRINGNIQLKDGVTRDQVKAALSGFLDHHQANFERREQKGEIYYEESNGSLYLDIGFSGYGGFHNEEAEDMAKDLGELSEDGEFFELIDDDTGNDDARCTPYFLAAPEKGRLEYGIQAMSEWVRPLVGNERFKAIVNDIRKAAEEASNTKGASA